MDKVTHQVRCEQWTKIINECLASEELHDMVTLKKLMNSYVTKAYVSEEIFKKID